MNDSRPETIAQRHRRIRAEKAAAEAADAEALSKLLALDSGLRALVGGRPLLRRSEHAAFSNTEWNELEDVCRKFRAFFPKLTLIQSELIARTHMKTNAAQLLGLPKAWHVWTDASNPTAPGVAAQ